MANAAYPTQNIHLPSNQTALRVAQLVSSSGGILLLLAAVILICDWLANMHIFGASLTNFPVIISLIVSAIAIFFYKKSNKFQLLGLLLMLIGLLLFITNLSGNSPNLVKNAVFIFFIGFSLIASILKIPHRYHFMQIIALSLLALSLYSFLSNLYLFLSSDQNLGASFWEAIVFFILCQSIVFIKPDRGFVGLFMTESRSAQLARMSLLYFATLPICLGFFFLIMDHMHFLDVYGRLTFLVVLTILFSIIISWINIRLLYNAEVEHFVMREAIRINNISLEMSAEDLSTEVNKLEKEKKVVADKLNNQQTLTDLVSGSS